MGVVPEGYYRYVHISWPPGVSVFLTKVSSEDDAIATAWINLFSTFETVQEMFYQIGRVPAHLRNIVMAACGFPLTHDPKVFDQAYN